MDICKRGRNATVVRKAHCNSIQRIVLAIYLPPCSSCTRSDLKCDHCGDLFEEGYFDEAEH